MDTKVVLDRLAQVLALPPGSVTPATKLNADIWDSMAVLGAQALADELYGIALSGDQLTACTTVRQLLDLIEDGIAAK